jgi:flagellar protein FlaJ
MKEKIFKDWKIVSAIAIGIGAIIVYLNLLLFQQTPIFAMLNLIAAIIVLGVPIWTYWSSYKRTKAMEAVFPEFLHDITESINAGMSLPQAIREAAKRDYNALTPLVRALAAKIEWGVPFERAMMIFSRSTGSAVIARSVQAIIEAHRSGGAIGKTMEAVTSSIVELERIKKERSTRVYSQMTTGYMIFFLFLVIMWALNRLLIPALATGALKGAQAVGAPLPMREFYDMLFRNLVLVQGVFSGIGIGKMAEGTIVAGFKHSFVLAVIGYTAFSIF